MLNELVIWQPSTNQGFRQAALSFTCSAAFMRSIVLTRHLEFIKILSTIEFSLLVVQELPEHLDG